MDDSLNDPFQKILISSKESDQSQCCAICGIQLDDLEQSEAETIKEFNINKFTSCNLCCRMFIHLEDLYNHKRVHFNDELRPHEIACVPCTQNGKMMLLPGGLQSKDSSKPLECTICPKRFHGKYELHKHRRDHFDRIVYRCNLCNKKFVGEKRFTVHSTFHNQPKSANPDINHTDTSIACIICEKELDDLSHLEQSLAKQGEPSKFDYYRKSLDLCTCNVCYRKFITIGDLRDHQRGHFDGTSNESTFACIRCLEANNKCRAKSPEAIVRPTDRGQHYCELCNKSFDENSILEKHKRDHFDRVVYECHHCSKLFIGQGTLMAHYKTHTNVIKSESTLIHLDYHEYKLKMTINIKFCCDFCNKLFTTFELLNTHKKNHRKAELKCHSCGKVFTRKGMLARHVLHCKLNVKVHAPPMSTSHHFFPTKTFICPVCDAEFQDRSVWKTHSYSHFFKDSPVFMCTICDEQFLDCGMLKSHSSSHYKTKSTQTELHTNEIKHEDDDDDNYDGFSVKSMEMVNISADVNGTTYSQIPAVAKSEPPEDIQLTEPDDLGFKEEIKLEAINESVNDCSDIQNGTCSPDNFFYDSEPNQADDAKSEVEPVMKYFEDSLHRTLRLNEQPKCALCGKSVDDILQTDEQILNEIRETKECSCRICGRYLKNIIELKTHQSIHFDSKSRHSLVACLECLNKGKRFCATRGDQVNVAKFFCDMCPKSFSTAARLKHHRRDHLDRCVYACDECPKKVIGQFKFTKHMYQHKKPPRKPQLGHYECHYCGRIFTIRQTILAHVRSHVFLERFNCHLCPASLKTKGNLKQHMLQHGGKKNVTCHVCGRAFFRELNLQRHLRSHTGERPFICTFCGKAFSYKENMANHMRIHTGEKPYKCEICDKRYRDFSDLRRHRRIHGGIEKTHHCEMCEKKFYELKYLKAHKLSAHNIAI